MEDTLLSVQGPTPTKAKPRKKGIMFGCLGFVLLAGLGGALSVKPLVRWRLSRQLAARGFEADIQQLSLGWGKVEVAQAKLKLIGVAGAELSIKGLVAEVGEDLLPRHVQVKKMSGQLPPIGSSLAKDLSKWHSAHRGDAWPDFSVQSLQLVTSGPLTRLWASHCTHKEHRGSCKTVGADGSKGPLASMGVTWVSDEDSGLEITPGAGTADALQKNVKLRVYDDEKPPRARLELQDFPLTSLPLKLSPIVAKAKLTGHVELKLKKEGEKLPVSLQVGVAPVYPPVPARFRKVLPISGGTLRLQSDALWDHHKGSLTTTKLHGRIGPVHLQGPASLQYSPRPAKANAKLAGAVPCHKLAKGALSGMGGILGDVLRGAASGVVKGNISLGLTLGWVEGQPKKTVNRFGVNPGCRVSLLELYLKSSDWRVHGG